MAEERESENKSIKYIKIILIENCQGITVRCLLLFIIICRMDCLSIYVYKLARALLLLFFQCYFCFYFLYGTKLCCSIYRNVWIWYRHITSLHTHTHTDSIIVFLLVLFAYNYYVRFNCDIVFSLSFLCNTEIFGEKKIHHNRNSSYSIWFLLSLKTTNKPTKE